MNIRFESELPYQREAIEAVTGIFRGQESCTTNFTVYSPEFLARQHSMEFSDLGYSNQLTLSAEQLAANVQSIQLSNGLKPSLSTEIDRNALDFTVEMETGTGKTYVYLRTIMELYTHYGFSKHIIVVPSIPIKEGVKKSLEITKEHFRGLYDNMHYRFFVYDSAKLNDVRDFALNDSLEIMVINIDAFSKSFEDPSDDKKSANIIHRYNDSLGYKPLDLIRNTRPIVFIDEPQTTISTPLRRQSVDNLNPLAIFRYSATHREKINLLYKLDAVDAYEQKLVKQIEIGSVQTEGIRNTAYIRLLNIATGKGKPTAQLEVDVFHRGAIVRKTLAAVKPDQDLEELTGRAEYAGYIVNTIHAVPGNEYIDFTSREAIIRLGAAIGNTDDVQIKTALIGKTIEEHLDKELVLNPLGIKVLSLFFIDSVNKYRVYDEDGHSSGGLYAQLFEAEYKKLIRKPKYAALFSDPIRAEADIPAVHNGYFSIDKKAKKSSGGKFDYFKDSVEVRATKADEDTYRLIMSAKEELLSFSSQLRFIFSHSALKEGWDNPNVFQICTLKDSGSSEIRRRQEIGRGLRLCVNQDGERVHGHEVNTLTVMATETYTEYAENLQREIARDTGMRFGIIEENSFHHLVFEPDGDEPGFFGQERSAELFRYFVQQGYIDAKGKVQELLRTHLRTNTVSLPEVYADLPFFCKQVVARLKDAAGKLEIRNRDDKQRVRVNRQVLDSPEFKALWDRVKFKTTFSVTFDSKQLVADCIEALNDQLRISRGKLTYSKVGVNLHIGGVALSGEPVTHTSRLEETVSSLPDIVGYLQNETQLTRKTIVQVLRGTDKLDYFRHNPQKFIEGCIVILKAEMRRHILDGIRYTKTGDADFYRQELFENEELFGYLNTNLRESRKSPFDYVVYDSGVESSLAAAFEQSANISVYAKLPDWFKIETPLGTYNPDWAVLWKDGDDEQLFFVVESKGSVSAFDLRPKETAKIACGRKHFEAMGSRMIVAAGMEDILASIDI